MKIKDLKFRVTDYIKNDHDAQRVFDIIKKNQTEMHLCDLDFALLLVSMDLVSFMTSNQLEVLCDSDFARLFAPNYFKKEIVTFDCKKRQMEIMQEVVNTLSNPIPKSIIELIDEHETNGEINLDVLVKQQVTFKHLQNNIKIEARTFNDFSFSLSQICFTVLYDVIITNTTFEAINDLVLRISTNPSYVKFKDINIPLLAPGEPVIIKEFDFENDIQELIKLTEKQIGNLTICLLNGEEELSRASFDMTFYSYDTWFERLIPNQTAQFVTPNEEAVKNICKLTAKTLEKQTRRSYLDDYQSCDKEKVFEQVKALYDTLRCQGIGYITVPASYEWFGQKIRIPHDVLKGKQGTCLDLAILFASCLESIGLHAGVVLITGHAYACVFLEPIHFPSSPYLDSSKVLEMCENEQEILLIECTAFTAGSDANFDIACARGKENTQLHVNDPNFEIIDIAVARAGGYLPLPISFDDVDKITVDLQVIEENKTRMKKKDYKLGSEKLDLKEAELNKFDLWEKKLLDLSRRNELIDFKVDKNGQQILTFDDDGDLSLNYLFNAFKDKGYQYTVTPVEYNGIGGTLAVPELTTEQYELYSSYIRQRKLLIMKRNVSLDTALKVFYRERRKAYEESGSNVLYMAIGFIEWFETDKSTKPKYAPIILVPIDLKRHSKDNYSIVGRDEPAFLNISIFEFFHQEFKMNFDDLLTKDLFSNEIEVQADTILNTVQSKIKKLNRARVIKTAAINIFRFSKAVMWQDIKYHRDDLIKNRVIKSIIDKAYVVSDNEKLTTDFDDNNANPLDLAIPLSADSSQIEAINDCALGKSFILQGPPGTGKSQTITNMIVNAIYHGKTVLFVAEKMAALEVVQKRLTKLSLDRFALEAHSIKTDKGTVMEQFKKRIELNETISDTEAYQHEAEEIQKRRSELNKIINVLHKKTDYFISFYDALVRSEAIGSTKFFEINPEYFEGLNEETFGKDSELIYDLENQIIDNGGYKNNPFILYRNPTYIAGVTKNKFKELIPQYEEALKELNKYIDLFKETNNISCHFSRINTKNIYEILTSLNLDMIITDLLKARLIYSDDFKNIIEKGLVFFKSVKKYKDNYSKEIFDLSYEALRFDYEKALNSGFFQKGKLKKKLVNRFKDLARNPKVVKFNNVTFIINDLKEIAELKELLTSLMNKYDKVFDKGINLYDYDFVKFAKSFELTKEFYRKNSEISDELQQKLVSKAKSNLLEYRDEFVKAIDDVNKIESVYVNEFMFDYSLCDKFSIDYHDLLIYVGRWSEKVDYLKNWSYLISIIDKITQNKLSFINDFIESNDYDYHETSLVKAYQKSVYRHIINNIIIANTDEEFNSVKLDDSTKRYKELIDEFAVLTVKETAARITSKTPITNERSASSSEIGILRSAIGNKCRGKSIRQLFKEIPNILTKYFPVFLMSPISCAQFLDHKMPKFDIVIFDEASQMPTSEAIGAISRGNSLIVVGDSMQLPPTSFFQSKGNDEDYVDLDDQESILSDCNVIGIPSRRLSWHYRSKHESLIRFSNARFYDNSLITFPSPNDMTTRVSLNIVNGIYERKSRNTNLVEAEAIVKEIENRIRNLDNVRQSIGVVTFSASQQELVEDKLDDMFAKHKDLEEKYNKCVEDIKNPLEPIIVKNLENIQGDERDVILFSVCYGPNKDGSMYYQFGPINKAGGEKRLNVAFSRARYEMIIYSSFDPIRLQHMNSASRGANELYSFLCYAKDGGKNLPVANGSRVVVPVGIEASIAKKLNERGYKTITNVGKSAFRVDIGVIDPDNPNEFVLGIVCDSYSYEAAKTARDRNIIQPSTLKLLGWNLLRIWSFDYLDDSEMVIDQIIDKIKKIKSNKEKVLVETGPNFNIEYQSKEIESVSFAIPYELYTKTRLVSDDHKSIAFSASIMLIVNDILELESPISQSELYRRVATTIGSSRAGADIQTSVDLALRKLDAKSTANFDKLFIWKNGSMVNLNYYRVSDEGIRNMEDVPKEEIIVAIKEVLTNNGPMSVSELKQFVARLFNIKSVKNKVNETLEIALDYYCRNTNKDKNQLVMIDDGKRIAIKE